MNPETSRSAETEPGDTLWRRSADAAYVGSPGRAVVLDLNHPELPPYVFESTAAAVWTVIDGEVIESEIVADLAEVYDAPVETLAGDVHRFLAELAELGLIVNR